MKRKKTVQKENGALLEKCRKNLRVNRTMKLNLKTIKENKRNDYKYNEWMHYFI